MPRFNLRSGSLSPVEEQVLRMRYGVRGYSFTPVAQPRSLDAKTAHTLSELEAKLQVEASGRAARSPR